MFGQINFELLVVLTKNVQIQFNVKGKAFCLLLPATCLHDVEVV